SDISITRRGGDAFFDARVDHTRDAGGRVGRDHRDHKTVRAAAFLAPVGDLDSPYTRVITHDPHGAACRKSGSRGQIAVNGQFRDIEIIDEIGLPPGSEWVPDGEVVFVRRGRSHHLERRHVDSRTADHHARLQPAARGAVLVTVDLKGSWTEVNPRIRDEAVQNCIESCCRAAVPRVILCARTFYAV